MVDTEHVIVVLTARVPAEYLDYLRGRGVSYIIAGRTVARPEPGRAQVAGIVRHKAHHGPGRRRQ